MNLKLIWLNDKYSLSPSPCALSWQGPMILLGAYSESFTLQPITQHTHDQPRSHTQYCTCFTDNTTIMINTPSPTLLALLLPYSCQPQKQEAGNSSWHKWSFLLNITNMKENKRELMIWWIQSLKSQGRGFTTHTDYICAHTTPLN